MARGAAWMVLFRLFDRSVGIVSTAVLARLLIPADFGLVAMAMSVIAVIELITAFSFDIALIQKQDPQREHYDTAWTLNLLATAAGASVTMLLAYPAATYYGDPRLAPVMLAIGAAWLVSGFANVGTVDFRRNLDFATEFRMLAILRVITFVATMGAAWLFKSYWALIIGTAAGRISGLALSYAMHPFRPRLSLKYTRELLSFSGWILLTSLAGVLLSRVPHFFIGRNFGAQSLGAYTVSAEIALLPQTELAAPINRALFPAYARMVSDLDAFRRTSIEATTAIFLFILPISIGVALMAPEIVRILLGVQWAQAVPMIQVLSFAGAVSALTSNSMSVYQALGRPRLSTWVLLTRMAILFVALLLIATRYGAIGVAYAELCAALGSLLVSVPLLCSTLQLPMRTYFGSLLRPVMASTMMGAALYYLQPPAPADISVLDSVVRLLSGSLLGALIYPLCVALLWFLSGRREGVETLIFRKCRDEIARRMRRPA